MTKIKKDDIVCAFHKDLEKAVKENRENIAEIKTIVDKMAGKINIQIAMFIIMTIGLLVNIFLTFK